MNKCGFESEELLRAPKNIVSMYQETNDWNESE